MRTATLIAGMLLLAASLPAVTELEADDLLRLHGAGLEAETLVSLVRASGRVFRLETEEILALKQAGLPEPVIRAMIETGIPASGATDEGEAPSPLVLEDGSLLLTNLGRDGETADRPVRPSPGLNVVPSLGAAPAWGASPYVTRTPVPTMERPYTAPISLPPSYVAQVREDAGDRGSFGIGVRWHPSWNGNRSTYYPTSAFVDAGYGAAAGYYYLPAAYGPKGASPFGRFGFHLMPGAQGIHHLPTAHPNLHPRRWRSRP